jgi:NodT family efflux transporter outer membrane factor (OMF) lipoprotein
MSRRKECLMIAALALQTACVVGPDYQRPAIDTGEGWTEPVHAQGPSVDLTVWWTRFGDPTLDRLIDRALDQNLQVRQAAARVAEARALRAAASSGRVPTMGTRASVTRRRQSENGPIPINQIPGLERDQTIYETDFDASWELDLFGGRRRSVEAADARLQAAIEQRHAAQLSVAAEVARSYFALRGAQHELGARQAAVAATRHISDLVHLQFQAGDVPEAAVAQAQAELTALQARLPPLQARIRSAALSVGVLLGELPESELGLMSEERDYVALRPLPVGKRADLLRRRPDVQAAERMLAAATADIGVATADLFPKIAISANGGFQSLTSGELLDPASQVASAVPLLSWRIFDGGRIRAEIHAREARAQTAALSYEQAVKQALTDAEVALTRYDLGLESLAREAAALDAAQRSYGYAQTRYQSGDISLLEMLDVERRLDDARDSYARTHTQAATDLVALFKALGGGWQTDDS